MSDASDQETQINKPQRFLLVILLALTPIFIAQAAFAQTKDEYTAQIAVAQAKVDAAQNALRKAQDALSAAQQLLSDTTVALNEADKVVQDKSTTLQQKQDAVSLAKEALDEAQDNYDNNLINDPTWVAPTYQKEHTRTITNTRTVEVRTQVPTTTLVATGGVLAEVFNRNGYNEAPPIPYAGETPIYTTTVSSINFQWGSGQILGSGRSEDVIVRFTGNLLVPEDGYYQFYAPADDGTKMNIAGMNVIDDWYDKGGGGTISDPVWIRSGIFYPFTLHYYENGGGAAVSLYSYTQQQGFSIVPTTWMGSSAEQITTYKEVITYEEEIYYTYETYYTTELVLIEGTINVDVGEGGEATFTAPAGATLIRANLRYESYNDPSCGASFNEIAPEGTTFLTIRADNSVFGDPCGGQVKHVVGTISYLGEPTAPLIKDPALLALIEEPTTIYNNAVNDYNTAQIDLAVSQASLNDLQEQQSKNVVTIDVAQENVRITEQAVTDAQSELEAIPPFKDPAPTPEKTTEPVEEPEEVIPPEVPEPITPTPTELPVNIETVNPQELTAEQVTELISVANEILNNSEQGSPEYEQALEALFVAAKADDIVVDENLAAIPLLGSTAVALADAINFMGNVGADMSPKVREESEKIVVTAVVAVGAAVNAATGAALTASAPAPGAGSNNIRRND